MSLKEELINTAHLFMKEGVESSKEMIDDNMTSVDELGISQVTPGEFTQDEITDRENLVNTAKMSNDNDFAKDEAGDSTIIVTADLANEVVDLSGAPEADIEVEDEKHECKHCHHGFAAAMESVLNGKNFYEILAESSFAGPTSFNPDNRVSEGDVLDAVKNAVDASIAPRLSVEVVKDENEVPGYKIVNAEEKDLPATISIDMRTKEPVKLKRSGVIYK